MLNKIRELISSFFYLVLLVCVVASVILPVYYFGSFLWSEIFPPSSAETDAYMESLHHLLEEEYGSASYYDDEDDFYYFVEDEPLEEEFPIVDPDDYYYYTDDDPFPVEDPDEEDEPDEDDVSDPVIPEQTVPVITYVLNTSSRKFHLPGCGSVGQMKDSNRWDFYGTRDEAISMGYVPCQNCFP